MDQFTALADPTRRSIVEMLAEGERSAGELAGRFSISQPAVSRHLRVLRESGLVVVRPVAQLRLYSLEAERLDELARWVARTKAVWTERFDRIEDEIRRARLAGSSTGTTEGGTGDGERRDGS